MSKLLLSAALAGLIVLASSHDAAARCRRYRYWAPAYNYWYSAPAAPMTAAPVAPVVIAPAAPAPVVAQRATPGYTYRSFSYDPQEAPVYPPPPLAGRREVTPYEPPFFRADHKMIGTSYKN